MVTWGTNTVHQLGAPASGFAFGSQTPAPSSAFGSAPSNTPAPSTGSGFSFGSTAPAPSGGGLFGSPAPAPSGGLFGAPAAPSPGGGLFGAPAPSGGGLFGSTPAPSGGGLFGSTPAPSGGLFGTAPAPGAFGSFGTQQPQQQQQPQLPAQAALQAHIDASARQEQARIQSALTKIHQAYTGTQPAGEKSSPFVTMVYSPANAEYQQFQHFHGMGVVGGNPSRPVAPPRPPQVSENDWEQTVVRNPNYQQYMPHALVGAEQLQGRLGYQQERANSVVNQLKQLEECRETLEKRHDSVKAQLVAVEQRQIRQRQKLLDIMQRVEVFRCYNNPLQPDEIKAMQKTADLYQKAESLASSMRTLQQISKEKVQEGAALPDHRQALVEANQKIPDESQLKEVLTEHRDEISKLVETVQTDLRDLDLIKKRLESIIVPRLPVPGRSGI